MTSLPTRIGPKGFKLILNREPVVGHPPSSRMPTSKLTRVRVEDLVKMRAQVWPVRGRAWCPRWDLNSRASRRMDRMSSRGSSSRLNRCFMLNFTPW